jgi:cell division septation protein DedD
MPDRSQKGLSSRHLILFFLAGVAVCGVFFALGFLVGYNQRPAAQVETERLVSSGAVPPTVNPPPDSGKPADEETTAATPGESGTAASRVSPAPVSPKKPGGRPAPEVSESNLEDKPGKTSPGGLTIQVVALASRQDAATLVSTLKTRGYSAFLVTPEQANLGDKLYRAEVGPFRAREQAEKVLRKLVDEGFKPFIRHD